MSSKENTYTPVSMSDANLVLRALEIVDKEVFAPRPDGIVPIAEVERGRKEYDHIIDTVRAEGLGDRLEAFWEAASKDIKGERARQLRDALGVLTLREDVARAYHEKWTSTRVAQGWVLGPEGPESSPMLRAWRDLSEEQREMRRETMDRTLQHIEKQGYELAPTEGRTVGGVSQCRIEAHMRSVLLESLAKEEHDTIQSLVVSPEREDVDFDDLPKSVREEFLSEADFRLRGVEGGGLTVEWDGRTQGQRNIEEYFNALGGETDPHLYAPLTVNRALKEGLAYGDINAFISYANTTYGLTMPQVSKDRELEKLRPQIRNIYEKAFVEEMKDAPKKRDLPLPEMANAEMARMNFKTKQMDEVTFQNIEATAMAKARTEAGQRLAKIADAELRKEAVGVVRDVQAEWRRDAQRSALGYDLMTKHFYDRYHNLEAKQQAYDKNMRFYASLQPLRRLVTRAPRQTVTQQDLSEARKNLRDELERQYGLPGKGFKRYDFYDGTSVCLSMKAVGPYQHVDITFFDGSTGWHQGFVIGQDGSMKPKSIGYPESEITVEGRRKLNGSKSEEVLAAYERFDEMVDALRCAALEPEHRQDQRVDIGSTDWHAFSQGVEIASREEAEKKSRETAISDELMTAYIEGTATQQERERVETALLRDPELREILDVIHKVDAAMSRGENDAPSHKDAKKNYVIDEENGEKLPEIHPNLPGDITARDYNMLVAWGFNEKDIRRLGIEKTVTVTTQIYDREKTRFDYKDPGLQDVNIRLDLSAGAILVSDPTSGTILGEASRVLKERSGSLNCGRSLERPTATVQDATVTVGVKR